MGTIEAKTADEIQDEFPETIVRKLQSIDGNANRNPYHSTIIYTLREIESEEATSNKIYEIIEEEFIISTSWSTVKDRCENLYDVGIFSKTEKSGNEYYSLSESTRHELEDNYASGGEETVTNVESSDTQSTIEVSSVSDRDAQCIESRQSNYVKELLDSNRSGLFLLSLSLTSIGGIFFVGGWPLLWTDISPSSGAIISSIGLIAIVIATILFLYLLSKQYLTTDNS